jgi:hypothetical protein
MLRRRKFWACASSDAALFIVASRLPAGIHQSRGSHLRRPPPLSPGRCVHCRRAHRHQHHQAAVTMAPALSSRAAQRFRLVTSLLVLGLGNYELWRIHKGIHPYWTPRLEEAGIVRQRNKLAEDGSIRPEAVAAEKPAPKAWIKWTHLNGVPIPTLEASVRPTRED